MGEVFSMKPRPNGLMIGKKRVPLGVVGIIYEARPNVTADAFCLCFKTGNAVILKGGSDALSSNQAIVSCLQKGLAAAGLPVNAVQLIADTDRETTRAFMRLNQYVDVLIPRGEAGLIRTVVENSTVPVIETGTGNCHIYVDETADFKMALDIIENAKTQRIGVCNACESLVIHKAAAEAFLPLLKKRLQDQQEEGRKVEIRAEEEACRMVPEFVLASEEHWGREYLDYILSVKLRFLMKLSGTLIVIIQAIPRRLLRRITAMLRNSWIELTRQQFMSMHRPVLQTAMNLALGRKSESALRSFTPEVLWGWRH